jgi:hypothetical protein
MNRQIFVLSILLVSATPAWAQRQSKWERVEKLPHGSTIYVTTTDTTKSCVFDGADEHSITCSGRVFVREDIQRIWLARNPGRAMRWGGAIGALLCAGIGASVGAAAGWRGSVTIGAVLLPVGFGAGVIAGRLFVPEDRVIYVHP